MGGACSTQPRGDGDAPTPRRFGRRKQSKEAASALAEVEPASPTLSLRLRGADLEAQEAGPASPRTSRTPSAGEDARSGSTGSAAQALHDERLREADALLAASLVLQAQEKEEDAIVLAASERPRSREGSLQAEMHALGAIAPGLALLWLCQLLATAQAVALLVSGQSMLGILTVLFGWGHALVASALLSEWARKVRSRTPKSQKLPGGLLLSLAALLPLLGAVLLDGVALFLSLALPCLAAASRRPAGAAASAGAQDGGGGSKSREEEKRSELAATLSAYAHARLLAHSLCASLPQVCKYLKKRPAP
ncbi:hypothetical protein T492DRAFT_1085966 [Pavlovales sp. CCMP2436]|nr:hypothetical protein T492DRAFT_1085966 [Pavlovales sp. CCMP2436]